MIRVPEQVPGQNPEDDLDKFLWGGEYWLQKFVIKTAASILRLG